jgi:hypothetical protein
MPYINRDADGNIAAISIQQSADCTEWIDADHPELNLALQKLSLSTANILESDIELIRVIEDLVDVLIAKSVISINDLPPAVQKKLLKRKSLRSQGGFKSGDELIKL